MVRAPMLEGLPPNNASTVLRLRCGEATARTVADAIVETFDPATTAAAAFEVDADAATWRSRDWLVEVFFATPPDEAAVRDLVTGFAGPQAAEALVFDLVAERDWVQASLDGLGAVTAGRFVVHGAHDRGRMPAHRVALEIEAALAFGTGHHGTTRGCLLHLDGVLARRRPRRILDVGTGTGVLAMAAAKALHRRIGAGDLDPVAVTTARINARLNGVHPWVRPVVARGIRHEALVSGGPYDLIFANILARPLRLLAPSIAAVAGSRAELILSGLLGPDVAGVLTAYRGQGFALIRRHDLDGWASLLVRRGRQRVVDAAGFQGS